MDFYEYATKKRIIEQCKKVTTACNNNRQMAKILGCSLMIANPEHDLVKEPNAVFSQENLDELKKYIDTGEFIKYMDGINKQNTLLESVNP